MAFERINTAALIKNKCEENSELKKAWEESRNEYNLIAEMTKIRKQEHITQKELGKLTGSNQQSISRVEKKLIKPSLGAFCKIVNALGYDLCLVKKSKN